MLITFKELGLDDIVLQAVEAKGFEEPTPIQVLAIPRLLSGEANVIAKARTGTGKTAAFGLPLVQELRANTGKVRALILVPTRELAVQVAGELESFRIEEFPRITTVYGGAAIGPQLRSLKTGVEIVVGTPGRVMDHLERGSLKIEDIEYFILDEADEMLNMGFIEDIENIFSKANPEARVLMFSATMPKQILSIASDFMGDYEIVEEEPQEERASLTEQFFWVVREGDKTEALVRLIDTSPNFYGLVFCQTKIDADDVAKELDERHYEAAALHGDIPQSQREKILERFRSKKTRILVATDVAARGIDIEGISHVVNYAIPYDGPTYTHRIGRTGRAGAAGIAVSFVRPNEVKRIEYLRKHARGELKEGKLPSIEQVIEIKRTRILKETAAQIEKRMNEEKPEQGFAAFANKLTEYGDAQTVLAFILQMQYGSFLSPSHYKTIKPVRSEGRIRKSGDEDSLRLYIGLGRKDGITKRKLAEMLSRLLSIPERLVDDIEVMDKFSLATMPKNAANDALRLCKKKRGLPHMHIDVKSEAPAFSGSKRPKRSLASKGRHDSKKKRESSGSASKYKRK
ncbi:DEAD/DEAH box helicase [Treponema sp. OMZ 799]|uniref:DEAD/DEAH box helicase n=1 Tax=Treponema sp. OMZ 799 TaxID=2563668 RepID=UPI0020A49105|nr:DEAD/DEAH box helicase [Treponema sp. OMZ 799]UTC78467.1 DEAD/DEAH box helicase [Treponema sp. OMZ 799]